MSTRLRRGQHGSQRDTGGPLLQVEDLRTYFETALGVVKAVDGVTFSLARGRSLGIVGESGSGKTILSRSIMGLLPRRNVIRQGSVRFEGQELTTMSLSERRNIWGAEMAMIFQDPMTSLNPVMKVGKQIAEPLRIHLDMSRSDATATALRLLEDVGIPEPEKRLGDLLADLHDRVERGHGVLEDHRHLGAPDVPALPEAHGREFHALEPHRAFPDHVPAGEQPHDRAGEDGLARARLADDAERAAARQGEADAVDRPDDAERRLERRAQVLDLEQRARVVTAGRLQVAAHAGAHGRSLRSLIRWPRAR